MCILQGTQNGTPKTEVVVKMEEDPSNTFSHFSSVSNFRSLKFFSEKYPLDLCIYCLVAGKPNGSWVLPVSNSAKVIRTKEVCQVCWLTLCV